MENLNVVVQAGRLTRDPELKHSNTGMEILNFSIAVNSSKKVGDSWEDEANFFDCVMFGKRAAGVFNFLKKGNKITVSGKLKQERWEKEGQTRSKVVIIVREIELPPRTTSTDSLGTNQNEDFRDSEGIPF